MDPSSSASLTHPITPNSFTDFHTSIQASALKATRCSASLPFDIPFYRSIDADLSRDVQELEERVLRMLNRILGLVDGDNHSKARVGKRKGKGKVEGVDDIVDNFHSTIVDSMDTMLERADICLDEFSGKLQRPVLPPPTTKKASSNLSSKYRQSSTSASQSRPFLDPALQHASHIAKPQLLFKKQADNGDTPWLPTLTHKYHAEVPLGYTVQDEEAQQQNVPQDDKLISTHPYYYEIVHLSYPSHVFSPPSSPVPPPPLQSLSYTFISTLETFNSMLTKLRSPTVTELAIDLEHHPYRTYRGFLCLMQISTRTEDFIVDLLVNEIREQMDELGEVFANPKVVKVFHGAESDVVWLQQDFNLYIVNLFDTFHSSKLLDFPRHGLANLLEMYCDYIPDKRYQLADWRIRPLPQEMLQYAQSDTHFLLFIYDNLRNALLDRSRSRETSRESSRTSPPASQSATTTTTASKTKIHEVLYRSSITSLRVYSKEPYDTEYGSGVGGWDTLAKKWNKGALTAANDLEDEGAGGIHAVQRMVYKAVHAWRENVSREEDESTRYVLPNHFLFLLAERPPADTASLLGMFRSSIPPVVRKRAAELMAVVKNGVRVGLEKADAPGHSVPEDLEMETEGKGNQDMTVDDAMEVDSQVNVTIKAKSSLWASPQSTSRSISTSNSALLGPRPEATLSVPSTLLASKSSLFGNTISLPNTRTKLKTENSVEITHFKMLLAKINNTLVIAPSIPRTIATTPTFLPPPPPPLATNTAEVTSTTLTDDPALDMQVEMPYVPISQRIGKLTMESMGPIVMVGQPKQKKRKRSQINDEKVAQATVDTIGEEVIDEDAEMKEENGPSSSTNTKSKNPEEEANVNSTTSKMYKKSKRASPSSSSPSHSQDAASSSGTYDFTAVPNILDHNPDDKMVDEEQRRRRKQKVKGGKRSVIW